jgi:prepilin-type N-terminal cleavage/methylation domain-containing protein
MQPNVKKAFTLLEIIFVILISGILSIGTFKAFQALYIRSAKAKAVTDLSMQSQIILDQVSRLLYNRIPNSVIGYDGSSESSCTPIEDINRDDLTVLEWLYFDDEQLLSQKYSGFIDMNASLKPNLKALGVTSSLDVQNRDLIFAGSFDAGNEDISTCQGAYGWHENDSNLSYTIKSSDVDTIELNTTAPEYIYEKYYLTKGAFAIARGADIDQSASCISDLNQNVDENTLLLFYEFYPYQGDTYCADNSGSQSGKVSILSYDVSSFGAVYENDIISLSIDMKKTIRGATTVHITKQKAVF